jgi:hypothetical protein
VLVAQQRQQRRDDHHRLRHDHRRDLVAGRLAEAGRQDDQSVGAGAGVVDHLLLLRIQARDAEASRPPARSGSTPRATRRRADRPSAGGDVDADGRSAVRLQDAASRRRRSPSPSMKGYRRSDCGSRRSLVAGRCRAQPSLGLRPSNASAFSGRAAASCRVLRDATTVCRRGECGSNEPAVLAPDAEIRLVRRDLFNVLGDAAGSGNATCTPSAF